jgi:hypothetical protein
MCPDRDATTFGDSEDSVEWLKRVVVVLTEHDIETFRITLASNVIFELLAA